MHYCLTEAYSLSGSGFSQAIGDRGSQTLILFGHNAQVIPWNSFDVKLSRQI